MSASAATAAPVTSSGELTHKQILTILSGLMLGMFLAALDQMIVSTAIRTIGDDLHGLSAQAWVTTAFLITSTISTPLYGKLSDIFGRKPLFLLAIAIFVTGSALCGLSQSMYMLAAFRAFQGIGAGGLMSLALAIIGDIIPPRERARYQGYFMAVFATSSVLGPVVGGFFAGTGHIFGISGWRYIFYINVPIGILAFIVVGRVLHLGHVKREQRIDTWGASALIVGLVPLLIIAEQGQTWGWSSGRAFLCYIVGGLGLAAFIWVEDRMGDQALIPLRLFRIGPFAVGSAQSFVVGIGMFGGMMSIPLYLQIVKGASPTKAGLLVLPMVLGMMVASLAAGQTTSRTGRYKIFPVVGSALMVVGMVLLSQVHADTALVVSDLYMVVFGAGLGLNMQSVVLAMQNAVSPRDMGVATSSTTFFRQVGGTLGTAVFLSILFSSAGSKIKTAYSAATGTPNWGADLAAGRVSQLSPTWQQAVQQHPNDVKTLLTNLSGSKGLNDTDFLHQINSVFAHPFLVGFSNAMDVVFIVGAGVLVFAFVFAVMLKEVPLRTVSAMQAARDEAAAAAAASGEAAAVSDGAAGSTGGDEPVAAGSAGSPSRTAVTDAGAALGD